VSNQSQTKLPAIKLHGHWIHAVTEKQCIDYILTELEASRGGWIVTPNLDHLRRLVRDDSFANLCAKATLMVADGMPLIWASRLQGTPLPERVTGSNLIFSLSKAVADRSRSIYLLGGDIGTAEKASNFLCEGIPGLKIAGTYYPELGFERNPASIQAMADAIIAAQPDIVYVAIGSPKQEVLIHQLRNQYPQLAGIWWLGVGISFSFLCGHVQRAPLWMQNIGLEWLHRLVQEPKRLTKRYLVDGLPFSFSLVANAMMVRLKKRT